jgi:8-oxo-dGTP diphosphatase
VSNTIVRTVGALLVDGEGRVLLGLRGPHKKAWPNHWDAVGGRVEEGETLEQAMIREVREEIGVVPVAFHWLAEVAEPHPELYGAAIATLFAVTAWTGGAPRNISDEHTRIEWFSEAQLAGMKQLAGYDYPRYAAMAREANTQATRHCRA